MEEDINVSGVSFKPTILLYSVSIILVLSAVFVLKGYLDMMTEAIEKQSDIFHQMEKNADRIGRNENKIEEVVMLHDDLAEDVESLETKLSSLIFDVKWMVDKMEMFGKKLDIMDSIDHRLRTIEFRWDRYEREADIYLKDSGNLKTKKL